MTKVASTGRESVRTAEVATALCLATDLAMDFPFEHGLHATRIGVRLGDRLEIDAGTASETYYACLLTYCGCTADAEINAAIFGGDLTRAHPDAGHLPWLDEPKRVVAEIERSLDIQR